MSSRDGMEVGGCLSGGEWINVSKMKDEETIIRSSLNRVGKFCHSLDKISQMWHHEHLIL